ncbi:formate dehydrogenase subunit gamma [Solirhodobacter olei]|uniref:formate dehydrogenase subunit gamma n=1 Tax=Solirhodobacter olei TaxID=2493082 RepID=UPI000FD9803A|nr:formate dehydrogenase subunit gamma [Solirhodobacter olei]
MAPEAVAQRTEEIVGEHAGLEGPLLPILHAVQDAFGYVPQEALPKIAEKLNITRAEVHGVVSFYHDFRDAPAGRHVVKLCRAEACQAQGAEETAAHAKARLGVGFHGTTPNGNVTLEPVFCLGLCACGPAAMVDGKVVGRVDAARLDEILAEMGA